MTIEQRDWAIRHDWARSSYPIAGTNWQQWKVICYDSATDDYVTFDDYQQLRAWAGY